MRAVSFCRQGLGLGLAALVIALGAWRAGAQELPKIEIVPGIPHSFSAVAFSPDGNLVLSGSLDRSIKLWHAATGALVRTLEGHSGFVFSVAFSPDGQRVLSGSFDRSIKLWEAATGAVVRTFEGHSEGVSSIAFSPSGSLVLSGSWDRTIKLWDIATGTLVRTFEGHSAGVRSVAFSPDGGFVLSGSADKTLRLWNRASGALLRVFEGHAAHVTSVAFSPDGTRIVSGSGDERQSTHNTVKLWETGSGKLIRSFEGHGSGINSVAFSPDGNRVLSGSFDATMKLWDAVTGKLVRTFRGQTGWIYAVAFSPDGTRVLGADSSTMDLSDAATGDLVHSFGANSEWVNRVAFSRDGSRVIASTLKAIKIWDSGSGALLHTIEGQDGSVFSPDRIFAAGSIRQDAVKVWNLASRTLIGTLKGHSAWMWPSAFSPDGALLLTGSPDENTGKLWEVATGRLVHVFEGSFGAAAFSPDGTLLLASGLDRSVRLWDVATGTLLRTLEQRSLGPGGTSGAPMVAFSPDGTLVLSGSGESGNTIRLWEVATGALVRTFDGHSAGVISVAFSPDGSLVLSGSADRTLRLWDAASGALVRAFIGHYHQVNSAAFSPDGRRIVSGSTDGTIRVWDTATGAMLITLIASRTNEWLAITPGGLFASSGEINQFLAIVRGLELTTIDQVHQSLFNPDLVREVLAGDPRGEAQEAAKVLNLEKVVDSGPAPAVAILAHKGGQSTTELASVAARIEDRGKGIGRIEWRVNGITAAVAGKPARSGPAYTVTQRLPLEPGDNLLEVVAYNASNLLASLPARTTIKFIGSADQTKPKLHILAIGINAYVDRGSPVRFGPLGLAVKDATAFGAAMKKAAGGLYKDVRVTLALDKEATRDKLEKAVAKIAREVHARDTFILFAAGHGTSENGRFYFIPQDYYSGPGKLERGAIGQDRLQDWLANRIKAKRAIMLLDTCESGALVGGHARSRTDTPASEAAVGRLHEATGRPVLTAAAAGQFAHEGLIGETGERHGVFTWALLDALRKGDSNGNGSIELSELVRHVQSVVPKVAAGLVRAASREPVFGKQGARFGSRGEDFTLAHRLQ